MARDHGPQIKDDALFEALVAQGNSTEKAARIANAKARGSLSHNSVHLEDRTKPALLEQARRIGIAGRSRMTKAELVAAIRDHG
ncbi:Rho termination factor N-terminal domain-containing protein [Sphingomonas abaci]|uniref:Rho termination factor-like N-terminal domain-containing protein n=1 Tax=Sphingomonas abaci TaxID=237611 RepID=A0A7W7EXF1_9SPHN|nr:Rho termination factor N-terminal domain-containing protein [Sphingomonas abaci]MBB4616969.1 hypothetical protein [Sphingomonas abaci]